MHLNHEKKSIYWIFGGAFVFAFAMFGLIALAKSDPIYDPLFYSDNGTPDAPVIATES